MNDGTSGALVLGIFLAIGVAYVWLLHGRAAVIAPVSATVDLLTRGAQISHSALDATGTVIGDPAALLVEAADVVGHDVDLDAYGMARMLRSEADAKLAATSANAKIYRAHVLYNDSLQLGRSIFDTVVAGKGTFGVQQGRRYSTELDPYENDLAIATSVINSRNNGAPDLVNGATKFVNTRGGFEVPPKWSDEGYVPVSLPDNPEADLVFLTKT